MPNIMRPFSLVPVFGDLEKEFSGVFSPDFESSIIEASDWQPRVDVMEEAKQFIVKIDVPGVDSNDIDISLDHNILTIKGEKEVAHKENRDNFIRYERSKGSFYRRIMLPDAVDSDQIIAKNRNGVLVVTIPKVNKGNSRKIKIQN